MKYDLLITGGNIYRGGGIIRRGLDIGIKDGYITEVGPGLDPLQALHRLEAKDRLVTPSFSDTHMHIDEAFTACDDDTTTLQAARDRSAQVMQERCDKMSEEELYQDIMERSAKVLDMCIKNGTTCIKTNVKFGGPIGTIALEAMMALKENYRGRLDLLTVVPCFPGAEEDWRKFAERGAIDFVGGYPNCGYDPKTGAAVDDPTGFRPAVDKAFELALAYDLPIDLHCNESDNTNMDCFRYIIDKTLADKLQRKVSCGHVTALDAIGQDQNAVWAIAAYAAKACVNVETLTSCNMYLMDWRRRGPTAVEMLLDNGVNVAVASDNIRDCFRPFGDADLIREAQLTAQVHKFVTRADMGRVLEMITYNAAENAMRTDYGTVPGCRADLVVLDAPDIVQTLLNQPQKLFVVKDGVTVAAGGQLV